MPPKYKLISTSKTFSKGQTVWYIKKGQRKCATIKKIYHDDPSELYFQIEIKTNDGAVKEIQTIAKYLEANHSESMQ